jgi:hypothetical protein
MLQVARAIVIGFALFQCGLVQASLIYIETTRIVSVMGESLDVPPESAIVQSDAAGVFDESRAVSMHFGDSFFNASASEQSNIGPNSITMTGHAQAQVGAAAGVGLGGSARHDHIVRFELAEPGRYRLDAVTSAAGSSADSAVILNGPNGTVMAVGTGNTFGGLLPLEFHEEVDLVAGMYDLSAGSAVFTFSSFDHTTPMVSAETRFSLVQIPATSTLALLLAGLSVMAWGARKGLNVGTCRAPGQGTLPGPGARSALSFVSSAPYPSSTGS